MVAACKAAGGYTLSNDSAGYSAIWWGHFHGNTISCEDKVNQAANHSHIKLYGHSIVVCSLILSVAVQRSKSAASPGALVAFVEPGSSRTSCLIGRAGCNQRDGMA